MIGSTVEAMGPKPTGKTPMPTASRKLQPEVRDVLERSTVTGKRLDLPPGQLDRKLYVKVADALRLMGGAWNKRERAHIFEEDAEQVVADAIASGTVFDFKKELQFFETPEAVARDLAGRAGLKPGLRVLEPSAGTGNLVKAIFAVAPVDLVAVEIDPSAGKRCAGREIDLGVRALPAGRRETRCADFLAMTPDLLGTFDRIVANPPFSRQQDILHVTHMVSFLRPGGRLVSVMSPAWTYRQDRRSSLFRSLVEEAGGEWTPLPDGSFTSSGTSVDTGILEVSRG